MFGMQSLPWRCQTGALRLGAWIRKPYGLSLLVTATLIAGYAASGERLHEFDSPDGRLRAVVTPADKRIGFEKYESRISILRRGGIQVGMHNFSSEDGEHGYGVDQAQWTPDSQYFVCRMRSSGGHSPMYAPVVFWSRKTSHFYQLNDYTAWRMFAITAPDNVNVDSWPGLAPATLSLGAMKEGQVNELH